MARKLPKKSLSTTESKEGEYPSSPKIKAYDQGTGYKLYGYHANQIPPKMRVPYILSNYRFPGMTADQCFESLLQAHNELLNIWSHVIALALFVIQVFPVLKTVDVLEEPYVIPLLCCILGICIMYVASVFTHLFNAMSPYMYHICFFFDYAAISSCFFIISLGIYFYSRPLNTTFVFFNSPELFLYLNLLNSLLCTYTCCSVLVKRPWYHILVRTCTYLSLSLFTIFPLTCRFAWCHFMPAKACPVTSLAYYKQCCLYFMIGGLIYSTRTPERFAPKMFDVVGQSHNIFHVLSAFAISHLFTALHTDMIERKEALLANHIAYTEISVMFTVLALVANLTIVVWLAKSLYSRQTAKEN